MKIGAGFQGSLWNSYKDKGEKVKYMKNFMIMRNVAITYQHY